MREMFEHIIYFPASFRKNHSSNSLNQAFQHDRGMEGFDSCKLTSILHRLSKFHGRYLDTIRPESPLVDRFTNSSFGFLDLINDIEAIAQDRECPGLRAIQIFL